MGQGSAHKVQGLPTLLNYQRPLAAGGILLGPSPVPRVRFIGSDVCVFERKVFILSVEPHFASSRRSHCQRFHRRWPFAPFEGGISETPPAGWWNSNMAMNVAGHLRHFGIRGEKKRRYRKDLLLFTRTASAHCTTCATQVNSSLLLASTSVTAGLILSHIARAGRRGGCAALPSTAT